MGEYAPHLKPARLYWFTGEGLAFLAVRSLWRFWISGKELHGPGDNATMFHDATVDYRARPYERLTRARWRRLAFRWVALGIPWLLVDLSLFSRLVRWFAHAADAEPWWWARVPWGWLALAWWIVAAFILGGIVAARLRDWLSVRHLRREYIRPAAEVLCRITGVKVPRRRAVQLIVLPPDFEASPEPGALPKRVRVYMPAAVPLPPRTKDTIATQVGARLGMPTPTAEWFEATASAYVDLTPAPMPPNEVSFASVLELIKDADVNAPLCGIAQANRPVYMDFDNDSPHSLGSAGSGAGKSTLYKLIAMQRMRHGAGAIFLDYKKWSHLRWLRGIGPDRVLYFYKIADVHNACCLLMEELTKRIDIDHESELDNLRRLDIYVEEINTLMSMLRDYWTEYVANEKSKARSALRQAKLSEDEDAILEAEEEMARANGLPRTSPAIQALRYGVNLGREFRVHFHFIGQSMSATAAGGRDTRESFRTRFLARWDRKTWNMLASGLKFIVCPQAPTGLWAHVHGSEVDIIRVPFVSDQEAREFVLSGPPVSGSVLSLDVGGSIGHVQRPALSTKVTLSEVVDMLPLKSNGDRMTLKALQLAAGRPGFPPVTERGEPGRPHLYVADEVLAWFAEREGLIQDQ